MLQALTMSNPASHTTILFALATSPTGTIAVETSKVSAKHAPIQNVSVGNALKLHVTTATKMAPKQTPTAAAGAPHVKKDKGAS